MTSTKTLFATARTAGVEILNEGFDDVDGSPGLDPSGFTTLLATVGGDADFSSDWARFSASLNVTDPANTLNYVGPDSVSVVTAVPEPSSRLMLALGSSLLPLLGRAARQTRNR